MNMDQPDDRFAGIDFDACERRAERLSHAPDVAVAFDPLTGALTLSHGEFSFGFDDGECPVESLWAWLAAIDSGLFPVACNGRRSARDVDARWRIGADRDGADAALRIHLRRTCASRWANAPLTSGARDAYHSVEAVESTWRVDRLWPARLRAQIASVLNGSRRPGVTRPGDSLDWQAGLPRLPDGDVVTRRRAFWWALAQAFAPAATPRGLLDRDVTHHRLARRWAWTALAASLRAPGKEPEPGWQDSWTTTHLLVLTHCRERATRWVGPVLASRLQAIDEADCNWRSQMYLARNVHADVRRRNSHTLNRSWEREREQTLAAIDAWLVGLRAWLCVQWPALEPYMPPALPLSAGDWVRHREFGEGRVVAVYRYCEPVSVEVQFADRPWQWLPLAEVEAVPVNVDAPLIGSAACGLNGPLAFPFTHRLQRATRRNARRRASAELGSFTQPLHVQASVPPMKALREQLGALAQSLHVHWGDVGELLPGLFAPCGDGTIEFDLLATWDETHCPRFGTRRFLQRLQQRFVRHYGQWQRRALLNGRYFPPPLRLIARIADDGEVALGATFAPGFVPGDHLVVTYPPGTRRTTEFNPLA